MTIEELEKVVSKWLLIKDKGIIKVLVATVIANRLSTDPVWLFIVGPSGSAKSELISSLGEVDGIYFLGDITPQSFLSGYRKNKNASLLFKLPKHAIFTHKDFTTVLSMSYEKRQAILSQLREIFDGNYSKEFGTGETKTWKGKVGFIAGVTEAIEQHQNSISALGERFIQYWPKQAENIKASKKAMKNRGKELLMREELKKSFAQCVSSIKIPSNIENTDDNLIHQISCLASFCGVARSAVIRDGYSREINHLPSSEVPTRLSKQLETMMFALSLLDKNAIEYNYQLVCKIAMDSIPKKRRITLHLLIENWDKGLTTLELANYLLYPKNTTRRILEDLYCLGLICKKKCKNGYTQEWLISKRGKQLLNAAQYTVPEMSEST